jgi:hypothetical protein
MKIELEKLLKEDWVKTCNFANNCYILRRGQERLIYDNEKKEVVSRYKIER